MTRNNRFHQEGYQEMYDLEYTNIKHHFDRVNLKKKSAIKKLNSLAGKTHHLTRKYISINDEAGANQCSRLHNEIEETLEGLVPIFENRLRKKITIGMIILCSGLGFWKGDYVKEQTGDIIGKYHEIIRTGSIHNDYSELEMISNRLTPKKGQLPHEIAVGSEKYPGSKYGIAVHLRGLEAALYDLDNFHKVMSFPVTASSYDTPEGYYKIKDHKINNSPLHGSVKMDLMSSSHVGLTISGTYNSKYINAVKAKRYATRNIFTMDSTIINLYYTVKPDIDRIFVVVYK